MTSTSINQANFAVAFLHLGCEKNLVDTEHMMGLLDQAGYALLNDADSADLVVVNTCSFIEDAREESVRVLVGLAEKGKEIIIAGCLAQHFQEELLHLIPEAKAVVGTGDYQHIVEVLNRVRSGETVQKVTKSPVFVGDEVLPRLRMTGKSIAYLKIAEGCDYRCAFCIIPKLRGDQRSRSLESIVSEAHQLAKDGVQELILISQITTNYGLDLYGKPYLAELLRALGSVNIPWIRIHYAYPTGLTPEVLSAYRDVPNVLPYLDLPLQHSHPEVLRAMNRPWQTNINESLITNIKAQLPDAVLRTTFIVGFPGETEDHFEHLCSFVKTHEFDHVGVFTFSPEEGTKAAMMDNQVPYEIAQARKDKIISIQQSISANKNQGCVGKIFSVLIEKKDDQTGEFIGRCLRFAPEVDGYVRLTKASTNTSNISPGMMVQALVIDSDLYDLTAELVSTK